MPQLISDDIAKGLGLDAMSPEKQEEVLERIGSLIFKAALIRVLELMSDQEHDAFDDYFEQNQNEPEKIFEYLETKVPRFNEILEQETERFKKDGLSLMNEATS